MGMSMQPDSGQPERLGPSNSKPSHADYQALKLWLGMTVFLLLFAILGLWLMSRAMRFALLVGILAMAILVWGVAKLMVYSVKKERRERRNGSGHTAPPIE